MTHTVPLINSIRAGEKRQLPARHDRRTCTSKAASLEPQEGCKEDIEVRGEGIQDRGKNWGRVGRQKEEMKKGR